MHVVIVGVFLALALALSSRSAVVGAEKALVFGTPTANLRVGPSVEQAIIVTLKEGDAVMVERLDGEWYQVTAVEGQKGFIHKNLLKFPESQKTAGAPVKASETKEAGKAPVLTSPPATPEKAAAAPAVPTPVAPAVVPSAPVVKATEPLNVVNKAAPAKSRALIDVLVGGGVETAIWSGVALLTFVLGWICGGIYSMRRERLKRSRIIF